MGEKIELCKTAELKDGIARKVLIKDKKLLVVRIEGDYYVADALCPHMRADLSEGKLEGTVITCPLHGSQFDLKDGSVRGWLGMKGIALKAAGALHVPRTLNVYKVEIDGDGVFVEV